MTVEERDAFLAEQRTCRLGTLSPGNVPHVTPVWYWWDGEAVWIHSVIKSQRWANLQRQPLCSLVVDAGDSYFELHGVELSCRAEVIGEVPREGRPNPQLEPVEQHFAERYFGMTWPGYDLRHAWLRLLPEKIVSWDFRKLSGTETVFNPNR